MGASWVGWHSELDVEANRMGTGDECEVGWEAWADLLPLAFPVMQTELGAAFEPAPVALGPVWG